MEDKNLLMERLAVIISEYFNRDVKMLKHKMRHDEISYMKHLFRYLSLEMGFATIPMIARYSEVTRASVYHSIQLGEFINKHDKNAIQDIKAIKLLVNEGLKLEKVIKDVKRLDPVQLDKLQEYLIAI